MIVNKTKATLELVQTRERSGTVDEKILKIFKDEELGDLEELQELARKADILSKRIATGKPKISKEKKFVYDRAQKIYSKFWSEQMAETIGKKSLANFSGTSPVSMLSDGYSLLL